MGRRLLALAVLTMIAALAAAPRPATGRATRGREGIAEETPGIRGPLAPLLAQIRDPDPDRRVDAAVALREAGAEGVAALADLLRHADAETRTLAARSLARIGEAARPALAALIAALGDDEAGVRLLAIDALARLRGDEAIATLLPMLRAPETVAAALDALREMGPATGEAALAIAAVLDPSRGDEVDRRALATLEAMGPAAAPALPALLRALANEGLLSPAIDAIAALGPAARAAAPALVDVIVGARRQENEDVLAALHDLGSFRVHPEYDAERALVLIGEGAIGPAVSMLSHDVAGVRRAGRDILANLGEAALPHLLAAACDGDPRVRAASAHALREHATRHPEFVPLLARLSADADPEVRGAAVASLGEYGEAATPMLVAALRDGSARVLENALASLERIAPEDPAAVPDLVRLLGHECAPVRWQAAEALASMGDAAAKGIPALVDCLRDPCPFMRESARNALETLGARSVPSLVASLRDAPPAAQLEILALHGRWPEEAAATCRGLLVAPDEGARMAAASLLATRGGGGDAALPVLATGLAHESKALREEAARGLAALGPAAAPALPEILRAAIREGERKDGCVHLWDALAAAAHETPQRLAEALGDPSWNLRYDARVALKLIGRASIPSLTATLANGPPEARIEAAAVLGELAAEHPSARAALEASPTGDLPAVRLAVLKGLMRAPHDERSIVPGLLTLARSAPPQTSRTAAYLLSNFGARAAFAVKEIRLAHADATDEETRQGLASTLEAIRNR